MYTLPAVAVCFQIQLQLLKYIYTMSEEEIEAKVIEWEETNEEEAGGTLRNSCKKRQCNPNHRKRIVIVIDFIYHLWQKNYSGITI